VRAWRKWLFRLLAVTAIPAAFFFVVELGLRLVGFGYSTDFFVETDDQDGYTTNQQFAWQFFPPAIARTPEVCLLSPRKQEDTYRIFVLGGSAANGTPDPSYAFGRMLEVMLRKRYPGTKFEVVNAAITAINSHVVLPIARQCAAHEPDLFIIYMGNNEVVGPYGSGTVFGHYSPDLAAIRASVYVKSTRIGQLVRKLLGDADAPSEWRGMEMFVEHRVAADDPRLPKVRDHFRRNLEDICAATAASRANTIVCTVAVNLRDCPPFASAHRASLTDRQLEKWTASYDEGIAAQQTGDLSAAARAFQQALTIDDRHAELHFRLATCLLKLEKFDEAREHFRLARDLDCLRFRADTRINEIIREVAEADRSGKVRLLDAEHVFGESSQVEHGLPGRTLFYEHVHLTPEGNYLLARTVFDRMEDLLPAGIRETAVESDDAAQPTASLAECRDLLALTEWDRRRMELEMQVCGTASRPSD